MNNDQSVISQEERRKKEICKIAKRRPKSCRAEKGANAYLLSLLRYPLQHCHMAGIVLVTGGN